MKDYLEMTPSSMFCSLKDFACIRNNLLTREARKSCSWIGFMKNLKKTNIIAMRPPVRAKMSASGFSVKVVCREDSSSIKVAVANGADGSATGCIETSLIPIYVLYTV